MRKGVKYMGLYQSLISEPQEDKIFNKDNISSEEDQYISLALFYYQRNIEFYK